MQQDLSPSPDPQHPDSRQAAAARANGAKSHGPTTPAVLARCTASAAAQITHGLRAQAVVIAGESEARFLALLNAYVAAHRPLTEPEHEAAFQMAAAIWRQRRALAFQTMDFNREIVLLDPDHTHGTPPAFKATLAFLASHAPGRTGQTAAHQYHTLYQRDYNRALKTFAAL